MNLEELREEVENDFKFYESIQELQTGVHVKFSEGCAHSLKRVLRLIDHMLNNESVDRDCS